MYKVLGFGGGFFALKLTVSKLRVKFFLISVKSEMVKMPLGLRLTPIKL